MQLTKWHDLGDALQARLPGAVKLGEEIPTTLRDALTAAPTLDAALVRKIAAESYDAGGRGARAARSSDERGRMRETWVTKLLQSLGL